MKPTLASLLLLTFLLTACGPITPLAQDIPDPRLTVNPGSLLVWERTGGFAGFCDRVVVYASFDATVYNCKGNTETTFALRREQRAQLEQWLRELAPINYNHSDGAVADGMLISFSFAGNGTRTADEQTIGLISQFASELTMLSSEP